MDFYEFKITIGNQITGKSFDIKAIEAVNDYFTAWDNVCKHALNELKHYDKSNYIKSIQHIL